MTSAASPLPHAPDIEGDAWSYLPALGQTDHAHVPDRVAEVLRSVISEGKIMPGTKLPEVSIAERLHVSRHTLRSAFHILATEGLVDRRRNRGVFVHQPTVDDVREIYRVRRIIQTGAVRAIPFSQAGIEQLRELIKASEQARTAQDVAAMAQTNQQFHEALIAQANSYMLDDLMDHILARMRLIFASMNYDPRFHEDYVSRNAELTELLAAGDQQAAEDYLMDYLVRAEEQLLSRMASMTSPRG